MTASIIANPLMRLCSPLNGLVVICLGVMQVIGTQNILGHALRIARRGKRLTSCLTQAGT